MRPLNASEPKPHPLQRGAARSQVDLIALLLPSRNSRKSQEFLG
jgi:hypothetical protein